MSRYFLAVQPAGLENNAELKQLLGKLKRTQSTRTQEARWVPVPLWHVTLLFIGDVSAEQYPRLVQVLENWRPDLTGLKLRLQALGAFPEIDHARVLYMGVQKNREFTALKSQAEILLQEFKFKADEKESVPHLTLARFRNAIGARELVELGGRKQFGNYAIAHITLFESVLEGNNVKYIPRLQLTA